MKLGTPLALNSSLKPRLPAPVLNSLRITTIQDYTLNIAKQISKTRKLQSLLLQLTYYCTQSKLSSSFGCLTPNNQIPYSSASPASLSQKTGSTAGLTTSSDPIGSIQETIPSTASERVLLSTPKTAV